MNCGTIKENDIASGAGARVSLFMLGCIHHYPDCSSGEVWDFNFGKPFTEEVQEETLEALVSDYIEGLIPLGGGSLEPENQGVLIPLLGKVRAHHLRKNLWCYAGYTLEQDLLKNGRARCEYTDRMLPMIDVLVGGRFVKAPKDISLPFRGFSNQHILNLRATLKNGSVKLLEFGSGGIQTFHGDARRYSERLLVLQFSW